MSASRLKDLWQVALRWLWVALTGLGLMACRPITDTSTPEPAATPVLTSPVEIRYVEATEPGAVAAVHRLTPEDAAFAPLVDELSELLATIDAQARTFFDPERFELEVASTAHVTIRYAEEHEFAGQDIQWQAQELAAAVVNDEPMLLARAANVDDWSVFLPASPQTLRDFIESAAHQSRNP